MASARCSSLGLSFLCFVRTGTTCVGSLMLSATISPRHAPGEIPLSAQVTDSRSSWQSFRGLGGQSSPAPQRAPFGAPQTYSGFSY